MGAWGGPAPQPQGLSEGARQAPGQGQGQGGAGQGRGGRGTAAERDAPRPVVNKAVGLQQDVASLALGDLQLT